MLLNIQLLLGPVASRGVFQEEQSPGRCVANCRFDRVAYIVLAAKELDVSSHAERVEDGVGLAVRRVSLAAG
jgi:hypothetical protein